VEGVEESWEIFLSSGEIEGSDPQGQSLHKILYQAYEKSQICSNVSMSKSVGRLCFPANQKTRQISRQTDDRFDFPGHSNDSMSGTSLLFVYGCIWKSFFGGRNNTTYLYDTLTPI